MVANDVALWDSFTDTGLAFKLVEVSVRTVFAWNRQYKLFPNQPNFEGTRHTPG